MDVESNSPLRLLWDLDTPILHGTAGVGVGGWVEVETRGMIDSKEPLERGGVRHTSMFILNDRIGTKKLKDSKLTVHTIT